MKSKTIAIHPSGNGFRDAGQETEQMASALPVEQRLHLCLITEEMLSMLTSVGGDLNAEFWLENEGTEYTLHLTAKQKLGNVARHELIQSSSSGVNEASKGFLGTLREMFLQAMYVGRDIDRYYSSDGYQSAAADISDVVISTPRWDRFERSVLLGLADDVRIGIRSGIVDLTVSKKF